MARTILTLARFALLEVRRTHVALLALALLGIGASVAWFAGQMAITETRQIQAVLTASFLRFAAVFLIAVFVTTAQAREVADKGIDILLSLPVPRTAYYLGKLLGYFAGAWTLAMIFGVFMLFVAPAISAIAWAISLGLELSIVAAASLFFITTLMHVPTSLAAAVGFYLLSRSMAAFQLIGGSSIINDGSIAPKIIQWLLEAIAAVLPRLDLFTQSIWLADQISSAGFLISLTGQAIVYVALLSAAGLFDLHRKNF